ncbi:hypothetical protein M3Y94_00680900 [Aphelenchoides besseyi]|nr:hypothetical protein M3Y94_00680900 [Aphelenchoides besseyi]KAI6231431.1 Purple acid phosphatase [Aphelenchoides besseyi]
MSFFSEVSILFFLFCTFHRSLSTHEVDLDSRSLLPEQVHLAYGGSPSKMSVTWITFDDTHHSFVRYGRDGKLDHSVKATIRKFVDGGKARTVRYVHCALIQDIRPGQQYCYRVGSKYGWSSMLKFRGLKKRSNGGFVYAIYGDFGYEKARSLNKLNRYARAGVFDMVIHNGDIAYDMDKKDGTVGDKFMRQIEPMSTRVPYMVSAGNHERTYNYSHYKERFTMPGTDHNLFYSFDLGAAHFVTINSEAYYTLEFGKTPIKTQWNWLVEDLKKANKNRNKVPWIIMYVHNRMYCTDISTHQCSEARDVMRDGFAPTNKYGLEKLIYDNGVDLYIGAHEHNYERFWPIYKFKVLNGTTNWRNAYENALAPIHFTTGSAGSYEPMNRFPKTIAVHSAFRSSNFGFTKMHVYNRTHIHIQQIAADKHGAEDDFWIVKHKHQSYSQ